MSADWLDHSSRVVCVYDYDRIVLLFLVRRFANVLRIYGRHRGKVKSSTSPDRDRGRTLRNDLNEMNKQRACNTGSSDLFSVAKLSFQFAN